MPKEQTPVDVDTADENKTAPLDAKINSIELIAGGGLVASITAELVDCWKHLPQTFVSSTQAQQQDVFRRFEELARTIVSKVAEIIAMGGDKSVKCVVGDAKVGSDIKVDLKLSPTTTDERDAAILFLAHARGRNVMVRMASADQFDEEAPEDPSEPDQAAMDLDAGTDEHWPDSEKEAEPVE